MNLTDIYSAYNERKKYPQDQGMQDILGPIEHQQFMQEVTKNNPALGTLLLAGTPFYTALKMIGLSPGGTGEMKTSRPSLDEIFRAWDGYIKGLK